MAPTADVVRLIRHPAQVERQKDGTTTTAPVAAYTNRR